MRYRKWWFPHTPHYALGALLLCLLLILTFGKAVQAQSDPTLVFLEEKLTLTADENAAVGHFTLQNKGPEVEIASFKAFFADEDGVPISTPPTISVTLESSAENIICTSEEPCLMPGYDVSQFKIELQSVDAEDSLTGYIEIDALEKGTKSGVVSEVLAFDLKSKKTTDAVKLFYLLPAEWATAGTIIGVSILVALFTYIATFYRLRRGYDGDDKKEISNGELGQISWDFEKNWLANVTGIVGITTTIVGLALLPETTQFLSKTETINEFAALPVFFGLGVIVAPLIGVMFTTIFPHPDQKEASGVWIFVLAVSIVIWSATGELLISLIFFDEIRVSGTIGSFWVALIQVILVLFLFFACWYAVKKTSDSSLKIIVGQDQDKAIEGIINIIENADMHLKEDTSVYCPAHSARDLKFDKVAAELDMPKIGGDGSFLSKIFSKLKGKSNKTSVRDILESMLKELQKLSCDDDGKIKARVILRATHSGLVGVLTAMRPKEDGTPQSSSASPLAVTKLQHLFSAAKMTPQDMEDSLDFGSEVKEQVKKIREYVKKQKEIEKIVRDVESTDGKAKDLSSRLRELIESIIHGDDNFDLMVQKIELDKIEADLSDKEAEKEQLRLSNLRQEMKDLEQQIGFVPQETTYVRPVPRVYLP